jgi:hypothetical protein
VGPRAVLDAVVRRKIWENTVMTSLKILSKYSSTENDKIHGHSKMLPILPLHQQDNVKKN